MRVSIGHLQALLACFGNPWEVGSTCLFVSLSEVFGSMCWQVLELQQQLKSAQHQLRVEEARAGESSRLERDSRDLSDTLSALRAQQQEEHITRSHKPV